MASIPLQYLLEPGKSAQKIAPYYSLVVFTFIWLIKGSSLLLIFLASLAGIFSASTSFWIKDKFFRNLFSLILHDENNSQLIKKIQKYPLIKFAFKSLFMLINYILVVIAFIFIINEFSVTSNVILLFLFIYGILIVFRPLYLLLFRFKRISEIVYILKGSRSS